MRYRVGLRGCTAPEGTGWGAAVGRTVESGGDGSLARTAWESGDLRTGLGDEDREAADGVWGSDSLGVWLVGVGLVEAGGHGNSDVLTPGLQQRQPGLVRTTCGPLGACLPVLPLPTWNPRRCWT